MYYLNSDRGAGMFRYDVKKQYFVDKTALIDDLYQYTQRVNRFVAITKPRRFGKSMAANMLAAFFRRGQDTAELFADLEIGKRKETWTLINSKNVIHMDFLSELGISSSYMEFITIIEGKLRTDLETVYPGIMSDAHNDIASLLEKTGESFIFIFDEWDAVFDADFMTDADKKQYILFLRGLFKNKPYVEFALLTGVLPIAKYTTGSPLNMFYEFNAFDQVGFEQYYGFSEEEIEKLLAIEEKPGITLQDIRLWYDGYLRRADGGHIFNPDSVCKALHDGICRNNWVGTGPMNDISNLIAENAFEVRDEIVRMMAGEKIEILLQGFGAEQGIPRDKKDILAAMVVYGFLTYYDGKLSIPNLELAQKFTTVLDRGTLGVHFSLEESRNLLKATLAGKEKEVATRIEEIHDERIPFIHYSDENSLACVILYAYYAAADWYEVKREEKSGKGYVDFLFTPVDKRYPPIILELKYNHSAAGAIRQIRQKEYAKRFRDWPEVLLVGINYSTKTKKHTCRIERENLAGDC